MKDFTGRYPGRKFDVMWYVDEKALSPVQVQAFRITGLDDHRWVPERGVSVAEGVYVFYLFSKAVEKLRALAHAELIEAKARIQVLEDFLQGKVKV